MYYNSFPYRRYHRRNPFWAYRRNRATPIAPSPGNYRRPTTAQSKLYLDDLAEEGITSAEQYDALDFDDKERALRKLRFREAKHYYDEYEAGNLKLTYPGEDTEDWGDFEPTSEKAARNYIWQFYDRQCERLKEGELEQSVTSYPFMPRYQEAVILLGQDTVDFIKDHVYALHGCGPAPDSAPEAPLGPMYGPIGPMYGPTLQEKKYPLTRWKPPYKPRYPFVDGRDLSTRATEEPPLLGMGAEPPGETHQFAGYKDLRNAGISAATINKIKRSKKVTLTKLNTFTADELAVAAKIPLEDAQRIIRYRDGHIGSGFRELRRYNPWRQRRRYNPSAWASHMDAPAWNEGPATSLSTSMTEHFLGPMRRHRRHRRRNPRFSRYSW
jgi:hypothetical protein